MDDRGFNHRGSESPSSLQSSTSTSCSSEHELHEPKSRNVGSAGSAPHIQLMAFSFSRLRYLTSATFIANIGSSALSLVGTMLLIRDLGSIGYGVYVYLSSIIGIASILTGLGFPTLLLREAAYGKARHEWDRFAGVSRGSNQLALLASVFVILLLSVILPHITGSHYIQEKHYDLYMGIFLVPIITLQGLRSSSLNGLGHTLSSILPGKIVGPFLFVAVLGTINAIGASLKVSQVFEVQLIIGICVLIALGVLVRRALPGEVTRVKPTLRLRSWMLSSLPFLLNGILMILNMRIDVVLLGSLKGPTYAGIYNAATTGAQFLVLALGALNTVFQPAIASAYSLGNHGTMKRLLSTMSRVGLLASLGGLVLIVLFSHAILAILFGVPFVMGAPALIILSLARTVNAGTGAVGPFLAMTGRGRTLAIFLALETTANIILNWLLIPVWGMNGSAIATGTSLVLMNLSLVIWTYRETGYDTSFIGYHLKTL